MLLWSFCNAATVTVNWSIGYVTITGPNPRKMIGVNNQWPIAPIYADIDDLLVLNVHNTLDVPTSLHSHGLFQNNTNYFDGAYGTTQCGIPPGHNFTYSIPIQQVGSYWIHGHIDGQYVDGLRAPLILKDPSERHDGDYIVSLSDFYKSDHHVLSAKYMNPANPDGVEPIPDAPLINDRHDVSRYAMEAGKTYRFRFISMTAIGMFDVWIDDHEMRVIEVDGVSVQPYSVQFLKISSAQRYSVLVQAKSSTKFNYALHAEYDLDMFDNVPATLDPRATALLEYSQELGVFTGMAKPNVSVFSDMEFVPVVPEPIVSPDVSFDFDVYFGLFEDSINHGTFNQIPYVKPIVPAMFSALSLGDVAFDERAYANVTNTRVLKHMDMVQIVIKNLDSGNHPFHLHGHVFQVLAKGTNLEDIPTKFSNANPMRRDTVVVPGEGYAIIRFRADNPGVWLFHCHVEWHGIFGLYSYGRFDGAICRGTPRNAEKYHCTAIYQRFVHEPRGENHW
jgi:iron transport multicopper oxidase